MATYMLEDSDQWSRNTVSRTDIITKGTRSWIETILEKGDNIFIIVECASEVPERVRFRKVLHRWVSSSDTDLNQLSNPRWTSLKVYQCDGWLEDHDTIEVLLTDDFEGKWEDPK